MVSHPLVLVKSPLYPRDTTECWICNGREDGRGDVNVGRTTASFTAVHNLHNDRFAVAGVCDCRSERDVTLSISLRIAVGQTVTANQDRACIGFDNRLEGTSHVEDLSTWRVRSANGVAVGLLRSPRPSIVHDVGYSSSVREIIISVSTCTEALTVVCKVPSVLLCVQRIVLVVQRVGYTV